LSQLQKYCQQLNLWLQQKKYSEELTMAAAQMESLNSFICSCSASRNAQINEEVL
jgi:hypothetical protein